LCALLCLCCVSCTTLPHTKQASTKTKPETTPLTPKVPNERDLTVSESSPALATQTQSSPKVQEQSIATRIATGLKFADCQNTISSNQWAHRYQKNIAALESVFSENRYKLDYVLSQLEAHHLPTEFAFLPMVESQYKPIPSKGNRPAGYWQFMPITARGHGLLISSTYDGRLNLNASTQTAIALLQHLALQFKSDWALVTLAYNAGEFRVRKALKHRHSKKTTNKKQILGLSSVTYQHLEKLTALSCLATQSNVLGSPSDNDFVQRRLRIYPLPFSANSRSLALAADMPHEQFHDYNAGYLQDFIPSDSFIMLPNENLEKITQNLSHIDVSIARHWSLHQIKEKETWASLAKKTKSSAQQLARIHHQSDQDTPPKWVILPSPKNQYPIHPIRGSDQHYYVIQKGDSLWRIARIVGTTVAKLAIYNPGIIGRLLRPGEKIRIAKP
jgi:membrane-bound lytic murein transglycosylase D